MTAISIQTNLSDIYTEAIQSGGFDEGALAAKNDTFKPATTSNTVKYSDLTND